MAKRKSSKKPATKKTRAKPEYQVFVSHATTDKWIATAICDRIVPVLCHVTFDAIPDIIEGKKAFHINDFDKYLVELKRRVKK